MVPVAPLVAAIVAATLAASLAVYRKGALGGTNFRRQTLTLTRRYSELAKASSPDPATQERLFADYERQLAALRQAWIGRALGNPEFSRRLEEYFTEALERLSDNEAQVITRAGGTSVPAKLSAEIRQLERDLQAVRAGRRDVRPN